MNQKRIYLTLCSAILWFCTLLFPPRLVFNDHPNVEWSFVFDEPTLKNAQGHYIGEGYMLSLSTLFIEWGIMGIAYVLLMLVFRRPKKNDSISN
jgi:hypothetical protein